MPCRGLFVFDHAVHGDAAGNAVTIALRHHVGDHRRHRRRNRERPRQAGEVRASRLVVVVHVAHTPCCVAGAVNLVGYLLEMGWFERFGAAASRGEDLVRPENAAESNDGDTTKGNGDHDDYRYPCPFENGQHSNFLTDGLVVVASTSRPDRATTQGHSALCPVTFGASVYRNVP